MAIKSLEADEVSELCSENMVAFTGALMCAI